MKKYYISFIIFVLAFVAALVLIYAKANPSSMLYSGDSSTKRSADETSNLEWHGRVENEYGSYTGTLINDLFHGEGKFSFLTGESYVGDWRDSYMAGNGLMIFPEIGEYSGDMNNSLRNGTGTFKWDTGEVYEGSWAEDEMSGNGKYTFSDGSTFEGVFSHNKPISGTYTYKSQNENQSNNSEIETLVYEFSDSMEHIVFTTYSGLKYDGDPSGLADKGTATIVYPSGNIYTGELSAGLRDGSGKYNWIDLSGNTEAYYEGNWSEDQMTGKGKYHYSGEEYPYLEGNFENGIPFGTLVYYKESGNTFETIWNNGFCISVKET